METSTLISKLPILRYGTKILLKVTRSKASASHMKKFLVWISVLGSMQTMYRGWALSILLIPLFRMPEDEDNQDPLIVAIGRQSKRDRKSLPSKRKAGALGELGMFPGMLHSLVAEMISRA